MDLRGALDKICADAIRSVDPCRCVAQRLQEDGERLIGNRRVVVLAVGKAALPMAEAAADFLGNRLVSGLAITKDGHGGAVEGIEVREADHPEPDSRGREATEAALEMIRDRLAPEDVLLVLVSGGASALAPAPVDGISLQDKQAVTRSLIRSGADIHEINAIRKHLSAVKGGRLLEAAGGARVVGLFLSDVVGDRFSSIGSGPTAPDPTTFEDCLAILRRYDLHSELPAAVTRYLKRGAAGDVPETVKPGDPRLADVTNRLVGNNYQALDAAAESAREHGFTPLILTSFLEGPTEAAASHLVALARQVVSSGDPAAPPCCLIAGGETTVEVTGDGLGGRNMELALQCVSRIAGWPHRLLIASMGTDGTDGPTDAAGALATPETAGRAEALGLSVEQTLADNDSYPFFEALGDLIITGPTRTNVMDIQLVLIGD